MIYLDNASTTRIDPRVLEAMMPYLTDEYGNAGTLYGLGRKSAEAIAKARQQVADLIGANPDQIVFTSGGSEANNMVFAGVRDYLLSIGKTHIVTTEIEHDSVLNAVKNMCKAQHVVDNSCIKPVFDVEYASPWRNGCIPHQLVIDCIDEITDTGTVTGLVSVMHTNNETGLKNMWIEDIGKACKERSILFHTDCVQAAGCSELNVDDIGCDFMSLSSHKIHGAKGVGALYVRNKSIMSPIIFGGSSQEFGLRGGTENVAGIVGFGAACEILRLNQKKDIKYIAELLRLLYDSIQKHLAEHGLENISHVNGGDNADCHGKTINMRFDNVDGETLLLMLDSRGICVSAGSACRSHESKPSHVLLAMGIDPEDARNSIRFSLSRMNTREEVEEAAEIIVDCVCMLYRQS